MCWAVVSLMSYFGWVGAGPNAIHDLISVGGGVDIEIMIGNHHVAAVTGWCLQTCRHDRHIAFKLVTDALIHAARPISKSFSSHLNTDLNQTQMSDWRKREKQPLVNLIPCKDHHFFTLVHWWVKKRGDRRIIDILIWRQCAWARTTRPHQGEIDLQFRGDYSLLPYLARHLLTFWPASRHFLLQGNLANLQPNMRRAHAFKFVGNIEWWFSGLLRIL